MTIKIRLKRRRTLRKNRRPRYRSTLRGGGNNQGEQPKVYNANSVKKKEKESADDKLTNEINKKRTELKKADLNGTKAKTPGDKKKAEDEIRQLKKKIQALTNKKLVIKQGDNAIFVDIDGNQKDKMDDDKRKDLSKGKKAKDKFPIELKLLQDFIDASNAEQKKPILENILKIENMSELLKDPHTSFLKSFMGSLKGMAEVDGSEEENIEKVQAIVNTELERRDKQMKFFLTFKKDDATDLFAYFNKVSEEEFEKSSSTMFNMPSIMGSSASKDVFTLRVTRAIRHFTKLDKDEKLKLLAKYIVCLIYKTLGSKLRNYSGFKLLFDQFPNLENSSYKNLSAVLDLSESKQMTLTEYMEKTRKKLLCSTSVPVATRKLICSKLDILAITDGETFSRSIAITPEQETKLTTDLEKGIDISENQVLREFQVMLMAITGSPVVLHGDFSGTMTSIYKGMSKLFSKAKGTVGLTPTYVAKEKEKAVGEVTQNRVRGDE